MRLIRLAKSVMESWLSSNFCLMTCPMWMVFITVTAMPVFPDQFRVRGMNKKKRGTVYIFRLHGSGKPRTQNKQQPTPYNVRTIKPIPVFIKNFPDFCKQERYNTSYNSFKTDVWLTPDLPFWQRYDILKKKERYTLFFISFRLLLHFYKYNLNILILTYKKSVTKRLRRKPAYTAKYYFCNVKKQRQEHSGKIRHNLFLPSACTIFASKNKTKMAGKQKIAFEKEGNKSANFPLPEY